MSRLRYRYLLPVLILAGLARNLYAVDGIILIDQNRALAGGVTPGDTPGFPVTLSQPGSYRLSGNLTMSTSAGGNFAGLDIAIAVASPGVNLDLNGFSITVTTVGSTVDHGTYAIAEIGTFASITVRNGSLLWTFTGPGGPVFNILPGGVFLQSSVGSRIEDLSINFPLPLEIGARSLVLHITALGQTGEVACPSIVMDSIIPNLFAKGANCVVANVVVVP